MILQGHGAHVKFLKWEGDSFHCSEFADVVEVLIFQSEHSIRKQIK